MKLKTTYRYIYIDPDGRLYNHTGEEVYILRARLLRIVLDRYCIACKNTHESYANEPCRSCRQGHLSFELRNDLKG